MIIKKTEMRIVNVRGERSDMGPSWLLSLPPSVWNTVWLTLVVIPRLFEYEDSLYKDLRVIVVLVIHNH